MKLLREVAYQTLIIVTLLGLMFVAFDLSTPAADRFDKAEECIVLQSADDKSAVHIEIHLDYIRSILIPFAIYLLACGGFIFLIFENIRLWMAMNRLKPGNKLVWTCWIILLGLMSLLPAYLGTSLIFKGLWYVFIIAAVLSLFYWVHWASKN